MDLLLKNYKISYADGDYSIKISLDSAENIDTLHVTFKSDVKVAPPVINFEWDFPHIDIQGLWQPLSHINRLIPNIWSGYLESHLTVSEPLAVLFSANGNNRLTFACTDAVNTVKYRFALREEDSVYSCGIKLFDDDINKALYSEYSCDIVLDYRDIPYEDTIQTVVKLWEKYYPPMKVYDECITPVYSTWYSFHQMAFADEMERVIDSARPLGFASVIVDDGWQMADYSRTYDWTGDWEVAPEKIPDMASHVKKIHDMNMKYFLWYSVPYVGKKSKAYEIFKDKFIFETAVGVLDPRYPEVREYLISKFEQAINEWDIDGFKLDFIDNFHPRPEFAPKTVAPGKDYESIPQAVERLLADTRDRLTKLKKEICIEFRQNYMGPAMRSYANMFRAADCADDVVNNKIRTIDLRLTMGDSPVHCDMLTWNVNDTVEAAALQLESVMFSVPQISVRPYELPESHNRMLKDWLAFWESHKFTLLRGKFRAYDPGLLYTAASAEDSNSFIAVAFSNSILKGSISNIPEQVFINASGNNGLYIEMKPGKYHIVIYNCMGDIIEEKDTDVSSVAKYNVPNAGRIIFH